MWLLWMSEIIANLIINFSSQCGFGRVHGLSLGFDCISVIIEGKYYGFCGGKQKILLKSVPVAAGLMCLGACRFNPYLRLKACTA